jgi:hypothetical protein
MLTQVNYNNLWTVNLGLPIQTIPCYYQYLQREVYFQDYLDLFCCPENGEPTNERLVIKGYQTVSVQGLNADPNGEFTVIDSKGVVRLIVEYDFPFDRKELCKGRKIKYILIGEAAPPSGSYIYKDAKGSYITAPLCATTNINLRKLNTFQKLLELSNQGFLLLDFFPFSINFEILNINLNNAIIAHFTNELISRINKLNCLAKDWDYCFVGPYNRTSIPIINWLNSYAGGFFMGLPIAHVNDLIPSPDFVANNGSVHVNHTNNPLPAIWNVNHLSKRAKNTVLVGNTGPNCQLIKRVFNLP